MKKPYIITVLTLCGLAGIYLYSLFTPIVTQPTGAIFYLPPAKSKKQVIAELAQQQLIRSPWLFSLYAYKHHDNQLKTGEYLFPKGTSPATIWKQLTTGTGLYYRQFTIIPGWNFSQLRKQLNDTPTLRHLTVILTDQQIMDALGYPKLKSEGEFFPETYYYTRGIQDLVILKRACDLMQTRLHELWQTRAANLPYQDVYQALIAASLIEKEAYLPTERPIIAGVLVNRLRKGMLLQFDPTVIYGLGTRYNGKIHKNDLLENTTYNTYVHKGLPPTPIAMPSISSLEAALHPQQHDYFYFVAKGDGSHQFSKTLPEHNAAVRATEQTKKLTRR